MCHPPTLPPSTELMWGGKREMQDECLDNESFEGGTDDVIGLARNVQAKSFSEDFISATSVIGTDFLCSGLLIAIAGATRVWKAVGVSCTTSFSRMEIINKEGIVDGVIFSY